jgi:uncharacterized protein (DUF111 family)
LAAGALDVHTTAVHMKKGRSGHNVTVLARPKDREALTRIALTETTTLGVRLRSEERIELERSVAPVRTPYGVLRVKIGRLDGREVHAAPEYEDCAAAARKHGVPLHVVMESALAARRAARKRAGTRRR